MRMTSLAGLALVASLASGPLAFADEYTFSFDGGGTSASGTFTVSPSATSGYDNITAITGTFTDTNDGISGAITGLYQPVSYTAPPSGDPAFTTAGFSYDDTFYPAGDSPHNCSDYPFFGGDFDVYGVAFNVAGGYEGVLWSDGNIPGAGLTYAAADGNATTKLDDPNGDGSDQTRPVGVPGAFSAAAVPEPGSLGFATMALLGAGAAFARKRKQ